METEICSSVFTCWKGIVTPLNMALRGTPDKIGNGKNSEVAESLGDWQKLIESLASRPTSVHELVAKTIDYYGYCDGCNTGAGGVRLALHSDLEPFIWRVYNGQRTLPRGWRSTRISLSMMVRWLECCCTRWLWSLMWTTSHTRRLCLSVITLLLSVGSPVWHQDRVELGVDWQKGLR